jgi:hypothetical protein
MSNQYDVDTSEKVNACVWRGGERRERELEGVGDAGRDDLMWVRVKPR